MLLTVLGILRCICCIATISALLLKLFPFMKISENFIIIIKKRKWVAIVYVTMVAIGLFSAIFSINQ